MAANSVLEVEELRFWYAVSLLNKKNAKADKKILKKILKKNGDWRSILKTLRYRRCLFVSNDVFESLLKL